MLNKKVNFMLDSWGVLHTANKYILTTNIAPALAVAHAIPRAKFFRRRGPGGGVGLSIATLFI